MLHGNRSIALFSLFVVVVSLGFPPVVQSARPSTSAGLLFPHNDGAFGSRGQLHVPALTDLAVDETVSISFQLSIVNPSVYGYVLLVRDVSGFSIRLTSMPLGDPPSGARLLLSVNNEPTELEAFLEPEELGRAVWHMVVLEMEPVNNLVRLTVDGNPAGTFNTTIPSSPEPELYFGATVDAREAPPMALKDLKIRRGSAGEASSELLHHWPLEEAAGSVALDVVGGSSGKVSDCQWLAGANSSWILEAVLKLDPYDAVFFDSKRSRVVAVGKEDMRGYFLQTGRRTRTVYEVPRPGDNTGMKVVYDADRDRIMSHHSGLGEVSFFDSETMTWSAIDTTKDQNQHFYEHASLVDPRAGNLIAIGGYGWYKVKNTVQQYVPECRSWTIMEVAGRSGFTPRMECATTATDTSGRIYVFGGFGNASGRQEAGFRRLRDLWMLDLSALQWEKLGDLVSLPEDFGVVGVCRPDGSSELFLAGGQTGSEEKEVLLYSLSLDSLVTTYRGKIVLDDEANPEMFKYDPLHEQFVLGVRLRRGDGQIVFQIHTLGYPPALPVDLMEAGTNWGIPIALMIILGAGAIGFLVWKRSRSPQGGKATVERKGRPGLIAGGEDRLIRDPHAGRDRRGLIEVFGRFRLHDHQGVDRTDRFTPRILELFLLILLHTRETGNGAGGISGLEISRTLWPHSSPGSAKDSRGVALKALREVLAGIGWLNVIYRKKKYVLIGEDGVVSEFSRYVHLLEAISDRSMDISREEMCGFIGLHRKGALLPEFSFPWLELIRESLTARSSAGCTGLLAGLASDQDHELRLEFATVAAEGDPLNEDVLRHRLSALRDLGRHGETLHVFQDFVRKYEAAFSMSFPKTIDEVFSSNSTLI
jgi:hypothetical protein